MVCARQRDKKDVGQDFIGIFLFLHKDSDQGEVKMKFRISLFDKLKKPLATMESTKITLPRGLVMGSVILFRPESFWMMPNPTRLLVTLFMYMYKPKVNRL